MYKLASRLIDYYYILVVICIYNIHDIHIYVCVVYNVHTYIYMSIYNSIVLYRAREQSINMNSARIDVKQ